MLSPDVERKLKAAFLKGDLKVKSVSPLGNIEWCRVLDVQRSCVTGETIHEVSLSSGLMVLTGGHRVFVSPTRKQEAEALAEGDIVLGTQKEPSVVVSNVRLPNRGWMYDLTADRWHNFVLHKSQCVVSNSPDRNYHFRPPAHEATINQYNQVFGFIWEDEELAQFIQNGVESIVSAPPRTPFRNCQDLVRCYPEWQTMLLTGAANYALLALMINWISDEFDYSIGGVSLSIEKSSKYESAANNFKDLFESQLERGKSTVKIIKGLQQPRFGIGIRSSFGPYAGRGQLTPSRFIGF